MFIPLLKIATLISDTESVEKTSFSYFDLEKSGVNISITDQNYIVSKNRTGFPHYLRGAHLTFNFNLFFTQKIPPDCSIIFFTSQMQKKINEEKIKKHIFVKFIKKILSGFRFKKQKRDTIAPAIKIDDINYIELNALENKAIMQHEPQNSQVDLTPEICSQAQNIPLIFPPDDSVPFTVLQVKAGLNSLNFTTDMNSSLFNPTALSASTMWISLAHADGDIASHLALSVPDECLNNMIFLVSAPLYLHIDLGAESKTSVVKKASFMRSDGEPVKIEPDFNKTEYKAISVKITGYSECTIKFDLKQIRKAVMDISKNNIYMYLRFTDRLSNGKLSTILPVTIQKPVSVI